ncbi:hypothetical protein AN189_18145 [Loktanella sp. 3ANDIMAR09]|uniref:hypothetical protein n=1 Tax=Loktanella sp. 3ANDIMAR09 TaxID=1225657 RepID=UPI0006F6CD4C|nr:hypothetical protein [Loktanella sp. 3ANDIMAR09]KQI66975.1 hypothetical protein AN189_18145 [Loktanella sp. 3ANDIMAR09]
MSDRIDLKFDGKVLTDRLTMYQGQAHTVTVADYPFSLRMTIGKDVARDADLEVAGTGGVIVVAPDVIQHLAPDVYQMEIWDVSNPKRRKILRQGALDVRGTIEPTGAVFPTLSLAGGARVVLLTLAEFDALAETDPNTLYLERSDQ